jgi:hypothetical protein
MTEAPSVLTVLIRDRRYEAVVDRATDRFPFENTRVNVELEDDSKVAYFGGLHEVIKVLLDNPTVSALLGVSLIAGKKVVEKAAEDAYSALKRAYKRRLRDREAPSSSPEERLPSVFAWAVEFLQTISRHENTRFQEACNAMRAGPHGIIGDFYETCGIDLALSTVDGPFSLRVRVTNRRSNFTATTSDSRSHIEAGMRVLAVAVFPLLHLTLQPNGMLSAHIEGCLGAGEERPLWSISAEEIEPPHRRLLRATISCYGEIECDTGASLVASLLQESPPFLLDDQYVHWRDCPKADRAEPCVRCDTNDHRTRCPHCFPPLEP